jgi:hypothetical protein
MGLYRYSWLQTCFDETLEARWVMMIAMLYFKDCFSCCVRTCCCSRPLMRHRVVEVHRWAHASVAESFVWCGSLLLSVCAPPLPW